MKKVTAVSKPVNIMPAMQILPSKQAKKVKGAVECEVCKFMMEELDKQLTSNKTEVSRSVCVYVNLNIHAKQVMFVIAMN